MNPAIPNTMRAATIDHFGGAEEIRIQELPVPSIGADEILIRVKSAGVGAWDPMEREGKFVKIYGGAPPQFPYVLGSDGAGTVAAVGSGVTGFKPGDGVYAYGFLNPKGGFYAEYAAVKADSAAPLPEKLPLDRAGAMPVDAITALRGLDDTLVLERGESVLIFGASGGVGHLAVQLAKRMGARVLAVASGADGVSFAKRLGADAAVDGKSDGDDGTASPSSVMLAARAFAPNGIDAALITVASRGLDELLTAVRDGGRVAYPNGMEPAPKARRGVTVRAYDGVADPAALARLNQLIEAGPFEVHVDRTFTLDQAADAQRALGEHHLGKIALRPVG